MTRFNMGWMGEGRATLVWEIQAETKQECRNEARKLELGNLSFSNAGWRMRGGTESDDPKGWLQWRVTSDGWRPMRSGDGRREEMTAEVPSTERSGEKGVDAMGAALDEVSLRVRWGLNVHVFTMVTPIEGVSIDCQEDSSERSF